MIPPADQLRNKRDREFQARVLSMLSKPRSSIWTAINSPLFLWFLSAALLSFGGAYFAAYQQCVSRADTMIESFPLVSDEYYARKQAIYAIVRDSSHTDEMRRKLKTELKEQPKLYVRFKDWTSKDLRRQLDGINSRTDQTGLNDLYKAIVRVKSVIVAVPPRYYSIEDGQIDKHVLEEEVYELKEYSDNLSEYESQLEQVNRYTELRPNCSASNILYDLFVYGFTGQKTRILKAYPDSLGEEFLKLSKSK
jgi:hypothetical protein